jgi:glycosyltransferase involved in cell wall biosynthesis
MKILFIHQNFPSQFKHLAPTLAGRGHEVRFLTTNVSQEGLWQGVTVTPYPYVRSSTKDQHPWLRRLETEVIRGESCMRACRKLKDAGYSPDLIVCHGGWGESLYVKEVWPAVKLISYCEYFFHKDVDLGFDPEFYDAQSDDWCWMSLHNVNSFLVHQVSDGFITPTAWQASRFPEWFRSKFKVLHEGVDTRTLKPYENVEIKVNNQVTLRRGDEVVTFVNRNLEPYRGFHVFMRSLPTILRANPRVRVFLVGATEKGYGNAPAQGGTWRELIQREVWPQLRPTEAERVHFLGAVPYAQYVSLLQLSAVHVYLTYPFVLSWSLVEAMSVGCAIVGSDTPPVREVITHGKNGMLVDFFSVEEISAAVLELLSKPKRRAELGAASRAFAVENFDLHTVTLPEAVSWVEGFTR